MPPPYACAINPNGPYQRGTGAALDALFGAPAQMANYPPGATPDYSPLRLTGAYEFLQRWLVDASYQALYGPSILPTPPYYTLGQLQMNSVYIDHVTPDACADEDAYTGFGYNYLIWTPTWRVVAVTSAWIIGITGATLAAPYAIGCGAVTQGGICWAPNGGSCSSSQIFPTFAPPTIMASFPGHIEVSGNPNPLTICPSSAVFELGAPLLVIFVPPYEKDEVDEGVTGMVTGLLEAQVTTSMGSPQYQQTLVDSAVQALDLYGGRSAQMAISSPTDSWAGPFIATPTVATWRPPQRTAGLDRSKH